MIGSNPPSYLRYDHALYIQFMNDVIGHLCSQLVVGVHDVTELIGSISDS